MSGSKGGVRAECMSQWVCLQGRHLGLRGGGNWEPVPGCSLSGWTWVQSFAAQPPRASRSAVFWAVVVQWQLAI